jgi:hypothetical protein
MNKKQTISRYHIIEKKLELMGATVELDMLTPRTIQFKVKTAQTLSSALEWLYQAWDDVQSVWQSHDDNCHYVGVQFVADDKYGEEE